METCVTSPRLRARVDPAATPTPAKCAKCGKCGDSGTRHTLDKLGGGCFNKFKSRSVACPFLNKLNIGDKPRGEKRITIGKKIAKQVLTSHLREELLTKVKSGGAGAGEKRRLLASQSSQGSDGSDRSDRSDGSDGAESVLTEPEPQGLLWWQPQHTVTRRTAQISREVYAVWQRRVGSASCIPAETVQVLFNDLQLFPSKAQVREMLECAKDCSGRPSPSYLTFGEFCVFARELKKCYDRGVARPAQLSRLLEKDGDDAPRRARKMSKTPCKHEVFLGGSCNPTTWRIDVAIPMLRTMGITFYNPQVPQWRPELLDIEYHAKENACVMFFVIDNQTRGVSALIEVAHIAGKRRKLILVIQSYTQQKQAICGEVISEDEYEDLRHGQEVLQDLVERQGIPVFDTISVALNCTAKVLRENLTVQELGGAESAKHTQAQCHNGGKFIELRELFEALDTGDSGQLCLADACCAIQMLTARTVTPAELRDVLCAQPGTNVTDILLQDLRLDQQQFCSLVTHMRTCPENGSVVSRSQLPLVGNKTNYVRDVYLGGTGKDTSSWREAIAIPILKKQGLTFFNPKVCQWSSRLLPIEAVAMEHSAVLLFVITNTARSLSAMAVAGHYIGLGCNVVLCVQLLPEGAVIGSEKLSPIALKDYNRGRMYLTDLAKRDGVPVFEDIAEAVECVARKCCER